ncbi:LADA_0E08988g1_1 [Lachancea dasiensis]|uniref:Stress response protein NST1 n=1 Tax=Lachancea dasiensis TaxID=1072105 RepID=A0A1G4JE71_9SACH|nr:LADA_0E08988g1_1 [Lachancea dasiensis]
MGKKRPAKKTSESTNNSATVVSGHDVRFELSDESAGASTRQNPNSKKSSIPQRAEAEVYDDEAEYPSSRVIKRAANGDVIVESLEGPERVKPDKEDSGITAKLDLHWESLSNEEKKRILRIEKQEVFEVIKNYQSSNNCNCSVCGRRNVAMEQELEQIYNRLYDSAKESNSDTDFVLFHLNMIKELQKANTSANASATTISNNERTSRTIADAPSPQYLDDMRDEAVKYCLSNKAVESLKEEVLQFKHNKQRQQQIQQQQQQRQQQHIPLHPGVAEHFKTTEPVFEQHQQTTHNPAQQSSYDHHERFRSPLESVGTSSDTLREMDNQMRKMMQQPPTMNGANFKGQSDDTVRDIRSEFLSSELPSGMPLPSNDHIPETNEELKDRYMSFAKTFVSSHPKIAHEYVNRMMMYPDMRALTEDLMYNNGQSFIKAMEDYVVQKGDVPQEQPPSEDHSSSGSFAPDRVPLTPEQYASIQRHIAAGMTASFESQARELQSTREGDGKGLFEQFLAGEDPISMLLKSVTKQTAHPTEHMMTTQEIQEEIDYDDEDEDEYEDDEYSDYEDEEASEYEGDAYVDDETDNSQYHQQHRTHPSRHRHDHELEVGDEDVSTAGNEEDYDSGIDEEERLEEGRRLIQIAITKLLQKKLVDSFHEKQAEENRLRLLQELEAEEQKKREKEEKKQRKREKEKEKKRAQQVAKEQEKRRKEEEEVRLKKEAEEREMQRRETQRQRVEEAKRKKDEERKRKLEEQRRKEEEQQKQKKLKEEQRRKREEEKRLKEDIKKQKEEELRNTKELKRLEQERRKQAEEAILQQDLNQARGSQTPSHRRLSTPPEAVPYGVPSAAQANENNDLFHMINEAASKSLSSSSSHLQALLQPQLSRTAVQQPPATGMSLPGMNTNANWQPSETFSNPSFDSLSASGKSLENSWSNVGGFFQASPRKAPTNQIDPQSAAGPQHGVPLYSQFGSNAGERKASLNDELDNLTNFLSSTSLGTSHTASGGFHLPEHLWSAVDQSSHPISQYMPSSAPPVNSGVNAQRKSIWENDAPLGSSPSVGTITPSIWGGINSNASAVSAVPTDVLADSILAAYPISSHEISSDYVDVERLYRKTFSLLKSGSTLTYTTFLNQLIAMRSTHSCEVLTNSSGSITHARFPFNYFQQQSQAGPPQSGLLGGVSENVGRQNTFESKGYPSALFDELYNGAPNSLQQPTNPMTAPGASTNHFNYEPSFGQSRTNNIWG